MSGALQAVGMNLRSFTTVPGAPTIGTATATGATTATVSYTAPANNGGSVITSYTATSSPGGLTGTLSQAGSGTITVTGLSANTAYTFTVTATNSVGTSAPSSASNSITIPGSDIAVGNSGNNFVYVYPWVTGTGFGTKYADPVSSAGGAIGINSVTFSSAGTTLAVGVGSGPPGIAAYPFTSGTGYGTKYANPSGGTGVVNGGGPAFNPSINAVGLGGSASPYVIAWAWSSGFGAKYADPATLPANGVGQVQWNPAGDIVATAHVSGVSTVYDWSSGFGTAYAGPGSGADCTSLSWNNNGTYIAFGEGYTTPFILVYPWSSGFGTRVSNPGTLPAGGVQSVQFNPAGTALAAANPTSGGFDVWAWSSGFGSRYSNPATVPAGACFSTSFNKAGNTIIVGSGNSPFIQAYPWSTSTGFGTKYANPSTLPVSQGRAVAFAGTF